MGGERAERERRGLRCIALLLAAFGLVGCKTQKTPREPLQVVTTTQPPTESPDMKSQAEVLAASELPTLLPQPLPSDPMAVTVHRLSNGMTVYLSENHEKPQVSAWIGVRAGGRMDPATSTGLAHYLEHMLFKGSDEFGTLDAAREAEHVEHVRVLYRQLREAHDDARRRAILAKIDARTQAMAEFSIPNEIDRMYSTLGVTGVNAFTSFESTVYIANVPSNRLAAWSRVEAERFSDPVFRLFLPELEAVYEEKNLSLDDPSDRVTVAGLRALFPRHPYGTQTVIGEVEHLKTPAYDDMAQFFADWYVPNNMAIALAGDIRADTVLPILERAFARLQPRPVPTPAPGQISAPTERVAVEVLAPGTESISVSYVAPAVGHADEPAVAVLDRLMKDGAFGLLELELGLPQKVADVGCWYWSLNEAGVFTIEAEAKRGQSLDEVEALVRGVVTRLVQGGFEAADVEAAKLQEHIDELRSLEGNEARVSKMMDAFTGHLEWADVVARDDRYRAVTRDDVIRVAKTYFTGGSVVVRRRAGQPEIPKLTKPAITPVPIDAARQSRFASEIAAMPAEELTPQWAVEGTHYRHHELPAGPLIAVRNTRNDLFALTYEWKRGYVKAPLLCFALELLEVAGAGTQTASDLQRELYRLGTNIDTSCDAEYSRITLTGVDRNFEASSAVLQRWLTEPAFTREDIDKLLGTVLTRRRDLLEQDRPLTHALETYAKFGRRSAWLEHPPNRTLAQARPAELRKLLQGMMDVKRRTLYFGPRTVEGITEVVGRPGRFTDPGNVWVRRYARHEQPTVVFVHKDGAKANVRLVFPQPPLPTEERAWAALLREYWSGSMSSLIFQEIRESRGLAYSAHAYVAEPTQPADESAFIGALSTQADKTPEASEALLSLLRRETIDAPRLANAKVALDRAYRAMRIDPRNLAWWVASWDDLGEPSDPRPREWQAILSAEPSSVEVFAARIGQATPTIAVLGDRDRVGLEGLAKLGRVVELEPAALFSFGKFD